MLEKYHFKSGMEETLMMTPQMQMGLELPQNNHHIYPVGPHCLEVGRNSAIFTGDVDVKAAAYIHDIGKALVYRPYSPQFLGHAEAGEFLVLKMSPVVFDKLDLDQKKVARLVGGHYLPMETLKEVEKEYPYESSSARMKIFDEILSEKLKIRGIKKEELWPIVISDSMVKASSSETEQLIVIGGYNGFANCIA